jgi:hypothetical protein
MEWQKTRLLSKLHSLIDYFVFFGISLYQQEEETQNYPTQGEQIPVEMKGPPKLVQHFEK